MPEIIETTVLSDNALLQEGITRLLDGARFHVSQRTTSLDLQVCGGNQQAPDLFIVVIDDMSCSIVGDIRRQFKSAKIVALALRDSRELMRRAMQLGAVGYLVESVSAQDLITSLEVVIANGAVFPPDLLSQLSEVAVEPQRLLQGVQRRADGSPFPGLYAAGEAAGFGGGGVHGCNALEGTFLGGCIFSGRAAGLALARELTVGD